MMDRGVLHGLLDRKRYSILKTLYFTKEEMYLRELAKKSGVPVSSVLRILQEFSKTGLLRINGIRMMKFYSLVRNEKSRFLEDWFKEESSLDIFVEKIKNLEGLKKAILHGKVEDNRANVILLGSGIDNFVVDGICEEIKEKGLDLSYLILTEDQFERLDKMGLYAGEKKVLV